jgi:hypothetical protein
MARTSLALFLISSLSTFASACADRAPAPVAAPAASPPLAAGTPANFARASIMERLTREAQSRPATAPRAEAVEQALAAAGLPLSRWKQVLGSPIGARFCMAGQTVAGSVVAVCEFGSPAEASAGVAYSHRTFDALIPNRSLVQRGQTVLTVTRSTEPNKSDGKGAPMKSDDADHVAQIFAAL